MPSRPAQACGQQDAVEALAAGRLSAEARPRIEKHLEECAACRTVYRWLTADRFPEFPGYTILKEIGRGGFGRVYKAFHQGKARVEALKVLSSTTPLREAYFANEVHLIAQLRHANIATLYEAHLDAPPLHYSMEYVEGQNLDGYCRDRPVSLDERIQIVKAVAAAVGYAHGVGVIHRDLKPQNILIDGDGQPRVVDFGISKKLAAQADGADGAARPSEGVVGTYGYVAPEQIAGQPVDGRADVYGLGVLLFHLITGQPARFVTQFGELRRILKERRVSRADDLAAIIACAAHALPEQRYTSCAALVQDLDNYLAGREIAARRDAPPGYRLARMAALVVRNHPAPVQVATAVLVVVLVSAALWVGQARWQMAAGAPGNTVLVGFSPATVAAVRAGEIGADLPELDAGNSKSWRLLHGRLLARLAPACPQVVVFDYFFPDCHANFDAEFIRGIRALEAPVVVGARDLDINGEPVLCPELRAELHGWGVLHSQAPNYLERELLVPVAVRRGFNPLTPALALVAYAAARAPDSQPDLGLGQGRLQVRYRKQRTVPGQSRWQDFVDEVPVYGTDSPAKDQEGLAAGDEVVLAAFPLDEVERWRGETVPYEAVLRADEAQLREWFAGRAVLVGQVFPGRDQHRLLSGSTVFGCELQAEVLDALLAERHVQRVDRLGLVLRVGAWCVLGMLLAALVPPLMTRALRTAAAIGVGVLLVALFLAFQVSLSVTAPWAVEATIGGCAVAAAGVPGLLLKLLHHRQHHLTAAPMWPLSGTGGSTTIVVGTPESRRPDSAAP